jgi:hypothetical protein
MRGMHWRNIRHRFNFSFLRAPRFYYERGLPFWMHGKQLKPASLLMRASSKARFVINAGFK